LLKLNLIVRVGIFYLGEGKCFTHYRACLTQEISG
jgi:hypothetical protein